MKRYKDVVKQNPAPKSRFGVDPSDPWSAKAGLAEGRNTILKKFILSKGIDPKMLSGDSMIAYSKSLEFQKWAADRRFRAEAVESPTLISQKRIQSKLNKHKIIHTVGGLGEEVDKKDTVTVDIPLLIRLLELAREDIKSDMDLHRVVEKLISIRNKGVLTMNDYDTVANIKESVSYGIGSSPSFAKGDREARRRDRQDDERWTPPAASKPADEPHAVHINGKKWKTFGSKGHAQAVANKLKGATIQKEETELDEMSGANMDTREVHQHLKKGGWKLSRSTGGHDVFTHPNSDEHIPVPRHRQLKAPLILSILKTAKKRTGVTEDKYQDPNAATQTTGMEVESKTSKLIKSLRKESTMKEELYDWEKEDKSVETYGKKPKFGKPNPNSKSNLAAEKPVARAVMSGGKTLTGETRDDVEIDPMMKNRPSVPMDDKKKSSKPKFKIR
jgi:predicted RNA binding protein YcfA (HicA-like mRNA interferase family)